MAYFNGKQILFSPKIIKVGIEASGSIEITENGTHDVSKFAEAVVNVESGGGGDAELWKGYFEKTLTSFVVPDGVTSIKDNAFVEYEDLESVELPDTIVTLGNGAFSLCYNLSSINFPNGLKSIGDGCFEETNLTDVELPDTLESLGNGAFRYNYGITSINLPEGLETIGSSCFEETGLSGDLTIPSSVGSIGSFAFGTCLDLTRAVFEGTPTYIAVDAFDQCEGMEAIEVPWSEDDPINQFAPWGAENAEIIYDCEV